MQIRLGDNSTAMVRRIYKDILYLVTFHPDGTFAVVDEAGPDEDTRTAVPESGVYAAHKDEPGTDSSTSSGTRGQSTGEWSTDGVAGHRHIAVHGKNRARSLAFADHIRAGVPADTVHKPGMHAEYTPSDGTCFVIKEVLKPDSTLVTTILCEIDEIGNITGEYPIDEKEIDATMPEMKEYAEALLTHKIQHFKCLTEIKRWEYKDKDPLLKLELKEGARPRSMQYKTPIHLLPELKKWIQEMLDKNFIRRSDSTVTAPILILKKPGLNKDGSSRGYRFVSDLRAINECIVPPQYFQPDVHTMYEKLRGAKVISTLDMKNGYFAAGLHPDSQYLTSFASPWGTFSYQVLSQGLISSAGHFQNWVEGKLRKHGVLLEFAVTTCC
jgi:hypothetical protein